MIAVTDEMVVDVLIAASGGEPPPYIFDSRSISDVRQALEKIVSAISPAPMTDSDIREEAAELVKELRYWADNTAHEPAARVFGLAARFIEGVTLAPAAEPITARYTNWRGETRERTFIPQRVYFGSNEWHPEPQVLIDATDCETGNARTFAAAGFAAPAAVAVAWMHYYPVGEELGDGVLCYEPLRADEIEAGWLQTPLYAAPPAPAADGWRPDAEKMREDCARWCEMNGFSEAAPMLRKLPISRSRAASTEGRDDEQ